LLFDPVGVQKISQKLPSIFPNPIQHEFYIKDLPSNSTHLELYNLLGKKVKEWEINETNSGYPVPAHLHGWHLLRMVGASSEKYPVFIE
jgi:hypothetical protein